jgi:hypothetical protein
MVQGGPAAQLQQRCLGNKAGRACSCDCATWGFELDADVLWALLKGVLVAHQFHARLVRRGGGWVMARAPKCTACMSVQCWGHTREYVGPK